MQAIKQAFNAVHRGAVFNRRVAVLSRQIAAMLPTGGKVLDMGCGDGTIARDLMAMRGDLAIEGVDIMVRPRTFIPVTEYDGKRLPFPDKAFDYVTVIDVLHHTDDPAAALTEAARVASKGVLVKDHLVSGFMARETLRFMDWVGNRGHDVVLPYNYLDQNQWDAAMDRAGLKLTERVEKLGLYPFPASFLFDRRLHFIALMAPRG